MNLTVNHAQSLMPLSTKNPPSIKNEQKDHTNFANVLQNSIENLNDSELLADAKTDSLVKGEADDLHEVMLAAQKASISLETTVQIQRKVIDAYNEVMRMQV